MTFMTYEFPILQYRYPPNTKNVFFFFLDFRSNTVSITTFYTIQIYATFFLKKEETIEELNLQYYNLYIVFVS